LCGGKFTHEDHFPFALFIAILFAAQLSSAQVDPRWKPGDPDRPLPPVITSGTASTQGAPRRPPSDAIVLFDGKDLSQWAGEDGQLAKWKVAHSRPIKLFAAIDIPQVRARCAERKSGRFI